MPLKPGYQVTTNRIGVSSDSVSSDWIQTKLYVQSDLAIVQLDQLIYNTL
jgi:hypothetical protein